MRDVIIWHMSTAELSPVEKLILCAKFSDYNLGTYIRESHRPGFCKLIKSDPELSEIFKKIKSTPKIWKTSGNPTEFVMNLWKFE